ncbi:MAG: RNA methyltransferase [Gemmatimonadetes bacterium]|nr:MAG: RNA methyltransferase [Gemmatimonadota bacterium]PYO64511.1 MAG: RNA methyltransferase [Gemmatimonadota bacterium]PYO82421.1 MAG: RNA methyltransferase [Gemmatimonadota bacterium]PYP61274.1 MAG: RNA methyltransferase [Gemmatimonadota bacterium]
MAFDEQLAARIRKRLGKRAGLTEKQMFGGIAFLLRGNMCVGIHKDELIVRLAAEDTDQALREKHTRIFDLSGGRTMKGWILVQPKGLATDAALGKWVGIGLEYAAGLPPKKGTKKA